VGAWAVIDIAAVGLAMFCLPQFHFSWLSMLYLVAFEALAAFSGLQTVLWTTWRCIAQAASRGPTSLVWARTIVRLGGGHAAFALLVCCLSWFLLLMGFERRGLVEVATIPAFEASTLLVLLIFKRPRVLHARADAKLAFDRFAERFAES
jgi:hypothetical protein